MINPFWCPHYELTAEDGEGRAICAKCGSVVVTRLTREIFEQQLQALKKRGR